MAARTFYILNTVSNANQTLQFQGSAPITATTTVGWQTGTRSNQFSRFAPGQANTVFSNQSLIDNDTTLVAANSFSSNIRLNGRFLGNWTFTLPVRAAGVIGGQSGRIRMKIWASTSITGLNARQLTISTLNGTTVTNLSTSVTQNSVVTWSPANPVSLNNEYLFFQAEWQATAPSAATSTRTVIRIDSNARLITGNFIQRVNCFT